MTVSLYYCIVLRIDSRCEVLTSVLSKNLQSLTLLSRNSQNAIWSKTCSLPSDYTNFQSCMTSFETSSSIRP
jgi:hypothetical protein